MANEPNISIKKEPEKTDIDDLLPGDLLSDDEDVIFAIKPSLWFIAFKSFRTVAAAVVICALVVLVDPYIPFEQWSANIIQGCGIAVLGRVGFAFLQWLSRTYVLTNRRVIRIRGVFSIDIFQCTLGRIQNTFLDLSLIQRFLGLGTISFTTAGTGQVEAMWVHLKHPLKIHHQLINTLNDAQKDNLDPGL